jgi:hypothetical protein
MGVDFIREQSGKPWRKRWDRGLDRLKLPGLFDVRFSEQYRTVSADLDGCAVLKAGDQVIVQYSGGRVVVCNGQQCIGSIPGIPPDMQSAITACGGVALGIVERVSMFGNNAELSLR